METYDEWTETQETATVTVDGHDLQVAYTDAGAGDPVVFLHGIPTNSFLWREVVPAVAEDHRAIAPDMLGYGNSSMDGGFDRSLRAQERMIEGLFEALDLDRVTLVGHDLGGGVFLRYAAHDPGSVDRLVLSNSVAYDSWPIGLITDLGLPETARETSPEELRTMLLDLFEGTLADDDPDEAFLEGMATPWLSEEGVTSLVRNAVSTNTNHTTEIDPSDVTADTLLLWGADDEFQSIEWAERLEEEIEDATLVPIEDANHWVVEDRPETYRNELLAFLEDG